MRAAISWPLLILQVALSQEPGTVCPEGSFGWKCRFNCSCLGGQCDPLVGTCEGGCREGRYGVNCQLEDSCKYDPRGVTYRGAVNVTSEGVECLPWDSQPVQNQGRQLVMAPADRARTYCRNPQNKDGQHAAEPWCYVMGNSSVTYSACGSIQLCDCPVGLYGPECTSFCHCKDPEEACHTTGGTCQSGCDLGWTSLDCQTRCGIGTYGMNCQQKCDNCNQGECHPETGECLRGCNPGLRGDNCSEPCVPGEYGRSCEGQCGQCRGGEACHPVTGVCFRGCAPGYRGDLCKVRHCRAGWYGDNCTYTCNCSTPAACHQHTGTCLRFSVVIVVDDPLKTVKSPELLLPICIVGAVIFIVLVCFILIKVRRDRERKYKEQEKKFLEGTISSNPEPPVCRLEEFDDDYETVA